MDIEYDTYDQAEDAALSRLRVLQAMSDDETDEEEEHIQEAKSNGMPTNARTQVNSK